MFARGARIGSMSACSGSPSDALRHVWRLRLRSVLREQFRARMTYSVIVDRKDQDMVLLQPCSRFVTHTV